MPQPPRPQVVLSASTEPGVLLPPAPPRRRLSLVLVPLAVLLLGIGWPTEIAREPAGAVELVLLPEQLVVTQSGVLVVPVELRNPGALLRVQAAAAYAEPVLVDPEVQAPQSVRAGQSRRFVALLAPDCRLLQPGSWLRFSASLLLKVADGSSDEDVVLDLAGAPVVRERVAALCRAGSG